MTALKTSVNTLWGTKMTTIDTTLSTFDTNIQTEIDNHYTDVNTDIVASETTLDTLLATKRTTLKSTITGILSPMNTCVTTDWQAKVLTDINSKLSAVVTDVQTNDTYVAGTVYPKISSLYTELEDIYEVIH